MYSESDISTSQCYILEMRNVVSYQGLPCGQAGTLAAADKIHLVVSICEYIQITHVKRYMQYDFLSYVPPLNNISYHGNGKGPYPVHTTCASLQTNAHILLHDAQA